MYSSAIDVAAAGGGDSRSDAADSPRCQSGRIVGETPTYRILILQESCKLSGRRLSVLNDTDTCRIKRGRPWRRCTREP